MATGGKAKTASKNNPTQRKKAEQKLYRDKAIKPVKYIDRDRRLCYISAEYADGSLVIDEITGNPMKWKAI